MSVLASVAPPVPPLELPEEPDDDPDGLTEPASLVVGAAASSGPGVLLPWSNGTPEFVDVAQATKAEAPNAAHPRAQIVRSSSHRRFIGKTSVQELRRLVTARKPIPTCRSGVRTQSGTFRGHGPPESARMTARA
jgi:hypothetical protein